MAWIGADGNAPAARSLTEKSPLRHSALSFGRTGYMTTRCSISQKCRTTSRWTA